MTEQPSKSVANQDKLDFLYDFSLVGGDSTGGKSLQEQIREAPEAALWLPLINWGEYKTSVLGQLAFNAKGIAQNNAELVAIRGLLQQLVEQTAAGVPVVIDYDRIRQDIKDSMPTFEIVPIIKEN
ncbi:hypothetical protein [Paenarthrobacter nitroguajacolicus]|uniref:hypothetical protein n=1 Tax=Paenarthrobacter nitroguajacolicus TaxID=211146 RepID=UPI0015BD67EC|nr:hypothetical protein [Paenarthrobacter nitroguajacolicus]NWL32986.1 hypothetical protein [Paenarthrobacter nitroguajacolicus]